MDKSSKNMTMIIVCTAASLLHSAAIANEVSSGFADFAVKNVATGETALQSEAVRTASYGAAVKTGGGTWVVPLETLGETTPNALVVREGALILTNGCVAPVAAEPTDVLAKAAMWLSAMDGERKMKTALDGDDTCVEAWFDVRETDVENPRHWFCTTNFVAQNAGKTSFVPGKTCPTLVEKEGTPSVWFGEQCSGQTMDWRLPNGSYRGSSNDVQHIFVVHGVYRSWGFLLGASDPARTGGAIPTRDTYLHVGSYGRNDSWGVLFAENSVRPKDSTTFVNGAFTDTTTTTPREGFQLLNLNFNALPVGVNAFFNDRDKTDGRCGGGYIAEAIVFTCRLTEAERIAVEAWLMQKWGIANGNAPGRIAVAEGARVEARLSRDASPGKEFAGRGTLVKYGSDAVLTLANRADFCAMPLAVDVAEGGVVVKANPLVVRAGLAYSTERIDDGVSVSVAGSGDAARAVKSGDAEISVSSIGDGVSVLRLNAGRTVFRPADDGRIVDSGSGGEVAVRNGSFENPPQESTKSWDRNAAGAINDWYLKMNGISDSKAVWVRYDGTVQQNTTDAPPPDGNYFFAIKRSGSVSQVINIPEQGYYEISFFTAGRADNAPSRSMDVSLVDENASITNLFGRVTAIRGNHFVRQRLRKYVPAAGEYRLLFDITPPEDGVVCLDDIRVTRVPFAKDEAWPIPNGDFESLAFRNAPNTLRTMDASDTVEGWVFSSCGIMMPGMSTAERTINGRGKQPENLYSDMRTAFNGNIVLAFKVGEPGTAVATFTPPRGTWKLRAMLSPRTTSASANGKLTASIAIGGNTANLGEVSPGVFYMKPYVWPGAFTSDGSAEATLTLSFSGDGNSAMLSDDFVLVGTSHPDFNFVNNESFERVTADSTCGNRYNSKYDDWTVGNRSGMLSSSESGYMTYSRFADSYGYDIFDGANYLLLVGDDEARQVVNLPEAGRYRLAFNVHQRGKSDIATRRDKNMLFVCVLPGNLTDMSSPAVTNMAVDVRLGTTAFMRHEYDFMVAYPGSYTLAFCGLASEGAENQSICLDGVSLRQAPGETTTTPLPETLNLEIAAGAKAYLGFSGTNIVESVRLDGAVSGNIISADNYPGYIEGPGALFVKPKGTIVIFK